VSSAFSFDAFESLGEHPIRRRFDERDRVQPPANPGRFKLFLVGLFDPLRGAGLRVSVDQSNGASTR
jgi:hypothetical protein